MTMPTIGRMAIDKQAAVTRGEAAMAALAGRSGTVAPTMASGRLSDLSRPNQMLVVSLAAQIAFLAEQLASLAAEIDELRAQLAKKGSSR